MTWNTTCPLGSVSVKSNKLIIQNNMDYISNTMGNAANNTKDHFWAVGANQDGHHRCVNMPQQAGSPLPTTGMDGIFYIKQVSATNTDVEAFYTNAINSYQFIPSFRKSTVALTNSYASVISVPANSLGQITIWLSNITQTGFFRSDNTKVYAYSNRIKINGTSTDTVIELANNDNPNDFNIRAKNNISSSPITYNYLITYIGI